MRLLLLTQFFVTPEEPGGTRVYEFGRHLASRGHDVTVLTAARPGISEKRTRVVDGINVIELPTNQQHYYKATALRKPLRIRSFMRFALSSSFEVLRVPKPDVVFASSAPLTIAIPGLVARARHRRPLVFEVGDLWPETPIQMGALTGRIPIRLARWLERKTYEKSEHVIAFSPSMRQQIISQGVDPSKVSVISSASNIDRFSPKVDGKPARERLGLGECFVLSYIGAMGEANDLTEVLQAAEILQERNEEGIVFLLVGEGKRRAGLENFGAERGLRNVKFVDPVPKADVPELLAATDVGLVIFKDVPILATGSPNKLFDILAAGRPALVNVKGWSKDLVEAEDAGVYVSPRSPEAIAAAAIKMRDDPDSVRRQGENARRVAEERFAVDILAEELLRILQEAAG